MITSQIAASNAVNLESLAYYGPELISTVTLVVALLVGILASDERKRIYSAGVTLIGLVLALISLYRLARSFPTRSLFNGLIAADPFGLLFKFIFLLATIIVALMVYESREIPSKRAPEFFVLLVTVFLGMSLLGSGIHLLILYLGLELISLPSYVLAAYDMKNRNSAEAGLKYLLYGAVSGGAFLYGVSLLYGLTGSFTLGGVAESLSTGSGGFGVLVALVLMLVGIGYKCSFFPMHMWVPDVYQGAPASVGGFLSTAPKAAGFAVLIRLSHHLVPGMLENPQFGLSLVNVSLFFFLVSAITMTIANTSALLQDNLKRMLGYSTVAHVGYILMGYTLVGTEVMKTGFSAIGFYLIVYTLMNLGAFLTVVALDREWLDEFDGMFQRAPLAAVTMAVFLFSLTGIPPLAGFFGKFYLFYALIQAGGNLFYLLALIGVINSVISFFYYARVLRHMFFNEPETEQPISTAPVSTALLGVLAALVVLIGIYPMPVWRFASTFLVFAS